MKLLNLLSFLIFVDHFFVLFSFILSQGYTLWKVLFCLHSFIFIYPSDPLPSIPHATFLAGIFPINLSICLLSHQLIISGRLQNFEV